MARAGEEAGTLGPPSPPPPAAAIESVKILIRKEKMREEFETLGRMGGLVKDCGFLGVCIRIKGTIRHSRINNAPDSRN